MEAGEWSWLEVAKLVSALVMPLAIVCLGIYVHRITKRFEHIQWRGQKLIEKRIAIYDDLAPLFNDLLCYFTYVGAWRYVEPTAIVSLKQAIDKMIYLAAPLFDKTFFLHAIHFQNCCYEMYLGWDVEAKLRTEFGRRRQGLGASWTDEWIKCFSDNVTNPDEVRNSYHRLMQSFAENIGISESSNVPEPGKLPSNIQ